MLAHNVFFSLSDASEQAKQRLVDACNKYLAPHEGIVFFACGTLAQELNRPVNDRNFDVALHVVFTNQVAHDAYQDAPLHHQFVDENKEYGSAKSTNIRAPTTREAPNFKLQSRTARVLKLGSWSFSGAWMLVLGALGPDSCH